MNRSGKLGSHKWPRSFTISALAILVLVLGLLGIIIFSQPNQVPQGNNNAVVFIPPTSTPVPATSTPVPATNTPAPATSSPTPMVSPTANIFPTAVTSSVTPTALATPGPTINMTTSSITGTAKALVSKKVGVINLPRVTQSAESYFSPDHQIFMMYATGSGAIEMWNTSTAKLIKKLTFPDPSHLFAVNVAWTADSHIMAIGCSYATDATATSPETITGHIFLVTPQGAIQTELDNVNDDVNDVAWSPDGKYLAANTGFNNNKRAISLWNQQGKFVRTLLTDPVNILDKMAWSPDSGLLAASWVAVGRAANQVPSNNYLQFWQPDGTLINSYALPLTWVGPIAWTPDSQSLALEVQQEDATGKLVNANIRLYDRQKVASKTEPAFTNLNFPNENAQMLAWTPNTKILAWMQPKPISLTSYTPEHSSLLYLWNTANVDSFQQITATGDIQQLEWSPDGTKLLALDANNGKVRVLNQAGQLVQTLSTSHSIMEAFWNVDGSSLNTIDGSGLIQIWH